MKKAKVIKVKDLKSYLPPKHTNTDSWALVTKDNTGCETVGFYLTEMRPGARADKDVHPNSDHVYFIISGRGKSIVEGEEFELEPGCALYIPAGCEHEVEVVGTETLRFTVLFAPPPR